MTTTHTLPVPGGRLRYEVHGSGPLLLVMGAPLAAVSLVSLTKVLARDFTVVIYDSLCHSRGAVDKSVESSSSEPAAEEAAALLNVLGAESADVFGSCVGAVTGLMTVAQHPGRIRTLVAHEPPLPQLLPEAAGLCDRIDDIVQTLHRDGASAAWRKYLNSPEFQDGGEGVHPASRKQSAERHMSEAAYWHDQEMRSVRYVPDTSLIGDPTRVVVGVGAASSGLSADSAATLAALLSTTMVEFPGDHTGFLAQPEQFADVLRTVLTD